jgi:hypothetical protein
VRFYEPHRPGSLFETPVCNLTAKHPNSLKPYSSSLPLLPSVEAVPNGFFTEENEDRVAMGFESVFFD